MKTWGVYNECYPGQFKAVSRTEIHSFLSSIHTWKEDGINRQTTATGEIDCSHLEEEGIKHKEGEGETRRTYTQGHKGEWDTRNSISCWMKMQTETHGSKHQHLERRARGKVSEKNNTQKEKLVFFGFLISYFFFRAKWRQLDTQLVHSRDKNQTELEELS